MSKIDIRSEELVTVNQAAKRIPGRPHRGTVWRWVLNGINDVKLESVKIGGRRFTSVEAIDRFIARTSASRSDEQPSVKSPPNSLRSEQADLELEKIGL